MKNLIKSNRMIHSCRYHHLSFQEEIRESRKSKNVTREVAILQVKASTVSEETQMKIICYPMTTTTLKPIHPNMSK